MIHTQRGILPLQSTVEISSMWSVITRLGLCGHIFAMQTFNYVQFYIAVLLITHLHDSNNRYFSAKSPSISFFLSRQVIIITSASWWVLMQYAIRVMYGFCNYWSKQDVKNSRIFPNSHEVGVSIAATARRNTAHSLSTTLPALYKQMKHIPILDYDDLQE